ncbi:MAG: hypothetical protein ACRD38_08915 [Nitrososphaerales archaeon]
MARRIRFTKHASDKFSFLIRYGFMINKTDVIQTISKPAKLERKGDQVLAMREINDKYALRVVYERHNGIIIVITFYPVKRKEYGI